MNIYIPFTYIIGWSEHKKFYYGAKYAQGCQPSDLWESYFTSSDYVKSFREEFGEPDIIKIHKTFIDKDSCVAFETQYLTKIDAKNHQLFLNESNGGGKSFYKKEVTEKEKEKTKRTHLKKYGYESSNQSEIVKENKRLSLLEKYGVEYNFQLEGFAEKSKQTCLEKYGYESSNSSPEIKEKKKQTCLEKYGVENYTKTSEYKEKSKQTCLEKYGVEYSLQSTEIREKGKETCLEKYGYESSNSVQEVKEKKKQSYLERYGVENPSQVEEFQEKKKETMMRNYGVEHALQSPEVKERQKKTNIERHGVEYVLQSPEIREKGKQTCLEKYGVDSASKIEKVCCYCGELKNIIHEPKCKKNPDRKVPNMIGLDNPSTKCYKVISPEQIEYNIISQKNLIEFAKQRNLKHYSFMNNNIEGWTVIQIEKPKSN